VMSLLAPTSCDQPLGIIGVAVSLCVIVGMGALGRATGMRGITGWGKGEGIRGD